MIHTFEEEKEKYGSKINSLIYEINDLRYKIQQLEVSQQDNQDNIDKLSNLYELGVIDEERQFINKEMEQTS